MDKMALMAELLLVAVVVGHLEEVALEAVAAVSLVLFRLLVVMEEAVVAVVMM